jgi:hypothetical protein
MLKVSFSKVANRYFDGPHTLTIINPDSQAAVVKFGATIESVTRGETEGADVKFSVVGANFKDPSSATWVGANDVAEPLGSEVITKKSEVELEVKVPEATVGPDPVTGKLCIVSPGGLITTFDLETKTQVDTPAAAIDAKPAGEDPADAAGNQPPIDAAKKQAFGEQTKKQAFGDQTKKQAFGDQTSTGSGTENNDNVEGAEEKVDDEEKPKNE